METQSPDKHSRRKGAGWVANVVYDVSNACNARVAINRLGFSYRGDRFLRNRAGVSFRFGFRSLPFRWHP